jgi:hypothetical protein
MDISLLVKAIFDSQIDRSAWVQKVIKPGDMFNIKIVEIKDDQHALVDFGKFRAHAKIQFPVKPGTNMLAKVTDTAGQLRLQVIDPGSSQSSGAKTVPNRLEILSFELFKQIQTDIKTVTKQLMQPLPNSRPLPPDISRALTNLGAHFTALDLSPKLTHWLPQIKTFVENSGVFFEKGVADLIRDMVSRSDSGVIKDPAGDPRIQQIMVRDLKPILLTLKAYLETSEAMARIPDLKMLANIKSTFELLQADINNQQSRAVQKHESPEPFQVFSFTLPLKEKQEKALLKLYCPKRNQGETKAGFKISLLLEMGRIGEIRADFAQFEKDLSITFFVKDDAVKTRIENQYEEVRKPLASLFNYLVLKTVVSRKKIEEFHQVDLDFSSDRQVDLRI